MHRVAGLIFVLALAVFATDVNEELLNAADNSHHRRLNDVPTRPAGDHHAEHRQALEVFALARRLTAPADPRYCCCQ